LRSTTGNSSSQRHSLCLSVGGVHSTAGSGVHGG